MAIKPLNFSSFLLVVDGNRPELSIFRSVFNENEEFDYEYSGTYFKVTPKYLEERYCFISVEYGNPTPRSDHLYNTNSKEKEENPRTLDQFEPIQNFILIDFYTSKVWLSNQNKKGFLKNILKEKLRLQEIDLKSVFNEEEFVNEIKKIKEISFSATPNLFTQVNSLASTLCENVYGYDASIAKLILSYNEFPVNQNILDRIKNLLNKRDALTEIVVSGKDKEEREMIFNTNHLIRKITIKSSIDLNERFEPEEVLENLKEEIERYE